MRAFIALPIPRTVQDVLGDVCRRLDKHLRSGVRWVPQSQIHLTLRFLGEIDGELASSISGQLAAASPRWCAWRARLGQIGGFPNLHSPRVLWVGIEDGGRAVEMEREVEAIIERLGIEREPRPFTAHLTLGRRRTGGRISMDLVQGARIEPIEFALDRLVLFQSTLTPAGAVHREEWATTLSERAS